MRKLAGLALLILLSGCAANPNPATDPTRNLSPQAKLQYEVMKVGKALDVIRDVSIEAEKNKVISSSSELKVLAYHKSVVQAMSAAPAGWMAIALKGLDELKTQLTAAEWKQLEPFVNLARGLIEAFIPTAQSGLIQGDFAWAM